MNSKGHQLMTSVHHEMASVQDAADHISYLRTSLDEKSQKLKLEIRSSFASISDQLRAREEQLLRQVDVLTNNQRTSLCTQVAKMYYTMGRLKSTLDSLQNDEIDLTKMSFPLNDMDSVKRIQLQSLPSNSLHLDTNKLETSIQEFGRLDVLCTLLSFPPPEGSRSLPSSVEDYQVENEDHHVMHKALLCQNSVKIRPPFKYAPDVKRDFEELSFDFVREAASSTPSDNGSISVISQSRSTSPYEIVSDSASPAEWLSETFCKGEKNSCNKEIEDSVKVCCLGSKGSLENVNDKWLSKKCKNKSTDVVPKAGEICLANEKCDSFRDCLCDPNCAVQWLRASASNSVETKRSASSLMEPMMKILFGKNEDYLRCSNKMEKKNEFTRVHMVGDVKNWLCDGQRVKNEGNEPANAVNSRVNEMFSPFFEKDSKQWLYH